MVKKGDTLVEVALAIGIFSMVAIAVVAVMVGGTSNAQNALETTLAREEIDTQAEALRFIHAAYLADEDTGENKDPFTKLWNDITKKAINPINDSAAYESAVSNYNTSSCEDIYKNENIMSKAFIINPRALDNLKKKYEYALIKFSATSSNNKLFEATTHPRLIYNDRQQNNADNLITNPIETEVDLYRAEGIFVIATSEAKSNPTFYDFYIRTCWYGTGSDSPSAISTVIRLYNPKGIAK